MKSKFDELYNKIIKESTSKFKFAEDLRDAMYSSSFDREVKFSNYVDPDNIPDDETIDDDGGNSELYDEELYRTQESESDITPEGIPMESIIVIKNLYHGDITYYVKYGDADDKYPVDLASATRIKIMSKTDEFKAAEQLAEEIADHMADNGFTFEQTLDYMNL